MLHNSSEIGMTAIILLPTKLSLPKSDRLGTTCHLLQQVGTFKHIWFSCHGLVVRLTQTCPAGEELCSRANAVAAEDPKIIPRDQQVGLVMTPV